jgi:hypothetical protein
MQNGSYKNYCEVPAPLHRVEIKESFTGKQQEYKGKQNPGTLLGNNTQTDR